MAVPDPSDAATPPAAVAPEDVGPRIWGVIDVVRPERIAGWAIDRGDAQAALEIDILREGRIVATVRADRPRKDLERGNVGTGRYGFACELSPPLEPGFEFTVSAVARTADGVEAELKRPGTALAAPAPERRIVERIFEEVSRLARATTAAAPTDAPDPAENLLELVRRVEVAQARIEAALAAVEPSPPPSPTGMRVLVGIAFAVGIGSLALGLYSMWQP